jgi:hypothetical protein
MTPLTDAELARQSYQTSEKLWAKLMLRMDGPMQDAVRKLAQIDHRGLQDQIRHLVAIGIRHEERRLAREAELQDQIAEDIDMRQRNAVRQALKETANGEETENASSDLREGQHGKQRAGSNNADARAQGIHRAPRLAACR